MTVLQAVLIGLIYYLGSSCWLVGYLTITRPLIAATCVGIVMGNPVQGAIIGAGIQMIYMGWTSVGGAQPSDACLAGTLATAYALANNLSVETALTLSVPLGLLGSIVWVGRNTFNVFPLHMADKAAERGDWKGLFTWNTYAPQVILLLITFVPVSLAAYFGTSVVETIVNFVGENVLGVLGTVGGILPAVGIALTLKIVMKDDLIPFYFLGFLACAYFGISVIGIAFFAIVIAAIYMLSNKEVQ